MNPALLELQDHDSALARLTREKAALDDGSEARARRDLLEKQLEEVGALLKTAESNRSDREAELSATEAKIAQQQQRMMTASSAHEISALERDIGGLSHRRGELDEAILMLMDEAETHAARVAGLEKQLADARKEVERIEGEFASETSRLNAAIARETAARDGVEAQLSPPEKQKYDASFKRHAGVAVARVVGGSCSACGTKLSTYSLRDAAGEEFPTCEACGRLLWVG